MSFFMVAQMNTAKMIILFSRKKDSIAPTVTITSSESSPTIAATIPITITFSEVVTGFAVGDITVVGCTLGSLTTSDNKVFSITATPTAPLMTFDVAAGICTDLAGNANTSAAQLAITSTRFLTFTCTTTGAATLTLQTLTVAVGKTVTVSWGDENSNTYTSGAGTRTHNYAGAGAWIVVIRDTPNITELDLRDTKLSGTISVTNPLPTGLTSLYLNTLAGLTWTVSATAPLPTGLTYLSLNTLAGLTWNITTGYQWPVGVTAMSVIACPRVTVSIWTNNAIRSIQAENEYSQAAVDAFINAIWANKANFTYATPTLDLLGGSNAAPSGTYQDATPPTTGNEKKYDLVNGSQTPAGPEWTVTTA